ncbi:VCBS repeat-containing protein [Streptomyces sp. NPDC050658]|uniref:FG-GAP repeat domain-containing protein n=1 Tax=unclassified Streptomyces TaxID=2593676 RepID=UPI003441750A
MADRTLLPGARALALCAALVLSVAGCGDGEASGGRSSAPSPHPAQSGDGKPVSTPSAGSPPAADGKGSKDPDDINGDGHRDLVLPVPSREEGAGERLGVVFGSAKGLDPSTHAVYDYDARTVTTADLDGDGYPDFVTLSAEDEALTVGWGGPDGPKPGAAATRIQPPGGVGLGDHVRGDFDGDGHHDLAAMRRDGSGVALLYGPFTRAGVPARSDARPGSDGWLAADAIAPSGKPRATGLLVHYGDDGEQTAGVLYPARTGSGLSRTGTKLREGNAVAFGDYDGDGVRDLAIGDDGSRNNEPGYETEEPEVDASLAVYPGKGGAPVTHEIPESRNSGYGPGGYASADPDGDGRDGILVATDSGALLIEGDRRTEVLREGPARAGGKKTPARWRHARPYPGAGADFDADGKDELIFCWGAGTLFGLYGEEPTHWWVTEGTSGRDRAAFTTTSFPRPR